MLIRPVITIEAFSTRPLGLTQQPEARYLSTNLTNFEQQTIRAAFVPGDGERTSDWTGLSMLAALESAGMSNKAEKITIVAIDGYTKDYTVREVAKSICSSDLKKTATT